MTVRISTGLRNFKQQHGSTKQALQGGKLEIYSGSQPATPETAVSGTLLCTVTAASGSRTNEVVAMGSVTLTGGSSGSVDAITVDGIAILPAAVTYATSLTNTATLVATAINNAITSPQYRAVGNGAVIEIYAMLGAGAAPNGFVVASTVTTLTKTDANMASGVTHVNGLSWGQSASGVLDRLSTQTWSGVNAATGTAGWFRLYGAVSDAGGTDSTGTTIRLDGAIAASGSDLNIATAFTNLATTTISTLAITQPAS